MKFSIKQKYFGDPPFCFRGPVPGRDPLFGKRCLSSEYIFNSANTNQYKLIFSTNLFCSRASLLHDLYYVQAPIHA